MNGAAQTFDQQQISSKPKPSRRKAYFTDTEPTSKELVVFEPDTDPQFPLPPGELKRVMSDKLAVQKATPYKQEANKNEITINGVTYYRALMHNVIYSIMNSFMLEIDVQRFPRSAI